MEEWKEYKLGNILQISSGFAYKGKDIGYGNNCLLGMGCVSFKEKFLKSGVRNYNGDCPEKYCVKPNDMVLATRQQSDNLPILGMPAIIPDDLKGDKIIVGANLYKVENKSDFDSQYIYWLLKSPSYVDYIRSCQTGTTVRMITKANIESYSFLAPNKKCRDRIVSILSSLDDKIEVNRRINEQLEELAGALFKSWFVDFEPFKDGEFVESELVKLGSVINTTSGGTPSRKHMEYYGGNHGWVKSKELNGTFIIDTEETITDDAIAKSSAKLLPEKSILIAMYGATVGQYAVLSKPMTCNQAVCALLPNDDYPYTFLFMFAKNKKDELINKAVGSAQQNISQILIKDLDISNDTKKIKEYHKIVGPAFEIILKKQQEIAHLTTLRDTLLPKLMSGEIDVNEVKI